ncbi:probable serine/threonine-protein kinase samkC [Nasonia vitripennis]|uniref:Uncharacterized protein n=1 Tax=Nasonia vitripennis TaxID=7425 RepID=A0A7M7J6J3_NASVI|nr:probable serine/threonine-protein kinase samkC [Nasonia vitripennis]
MTITSSQESEKSAEKKERRKLSLSLKKTDLPPPSPRQQTSPQPLYHGDQPMRLQHQADQPMPLEHQADQPMPLQHQQELQMSLQQRARPRILHDEMLNDPLIVFDKKANMRNKSE